MRLTLETERLILRPFREDDAEDMFYGWASDDEVTKYLTWNTHKSIDETKYILNLYLSKFKFIHLIQLWNLLLHNHLLKH